MIPLARHLVDAVHVGGVHQVLLVQGQVVGLAVLLARAREHYLHRGVVVPARFEQGKLAAAVYLQVGERVGHRVEVADLPSEVEDIVLVLHQEVHGGLGAYVGDVDAHAVLNARDVEGVAAVLGDKRIDQQHLGL